MLFNKVIINHTFGKNYVLVNFTSQDDLSGAKVAIVTPCVTIHCLDERTLEVLIFKWWWNTQMNGWILNLSGITSVECHCRAELVTPTLQVKGLFIAQFLRCKKKCGLCGNTDVTLSQTNTSATSAQIWPMHYPLQMRIYGLNLTPTPVVAFA